MSSRRRTLPCTVCGVRLPVQQSTETVICREHLKNEPTFGTAFPDVSSPLAMIKAGRYVLSEGQAEAFDTDEEYRLRFLRKLRRLGFKGKIYAPSNLVGKWNGQEMW